MQDAINLEEVILPVHVGALEEERKTTQPIRLDVRMHFNARPAGRSDKLEDTLNYEEAYRRLQTVAASRPFVLLESLCEEIAETLMEQRAQIVWVRAQKVRCPIPGMQGRISVEILRSTDETG